MTYEEQLLTIEWNELRFKILFRDNYECQVCGSSKELNVHHLIYIYGRMAWEYEDMFLITLCKKHHEIEHKCLESLKEYHIKKHLTSGMLAIDIINKVIHNESITI